MCIVNRWRPGIRSLAPRAAVGFLPGVFAFSVLCLAPGVAQADCALIHPGRTANPQGNGFRVIEEGEAAPLDLAAIDNGIAMWTRACRLEAPSFDPAGNIQIRQEP